MTIERLTNEEREAVRRGTCQASGPKALRIIDQLTAALDAAEEINHAMSAKIAADQYDYKTRAESLQARVAELEAQLSRTDEAGVANTREWRAAESRAEALQARTVELESRLERVAAGALR